MSTNKSTVGRTAVESEAFTEATQGCEIFYSIVKSKYDLSSSQQILRDHLRQQHHNRHFAYISHRCEQGDQWGGSDLQIHLAILLQTSGSDWRTNLFHTVHGKPFLLHGAFFLKSFRFYLFSHINTKQWNDTMFHLEEQKQHNTTQVQTGQNTVKREQGRERARKTQE